MELLNILINDIIYFQARFIDDIFLVIDITDLVDIDSWLQNLFVHEYLTFTFVYDLHSINFLDVIVKLNEDNSIQTSLYKKPMSKHLYLHYKSNHPKCLLNSIPYSQGLRIIKICSEKEDRNSKLIDLMSQFKIRGYPVNNLHNTYLKLLDIDRNNLLIPKGNNIISHISLFNPEILNAFNIEPNTIKLKDNIVYIVFPFYNNIPNLKLLIINKIKSLISNCNNVVIKECANSLQLVLSFKKTKSICNIVSYLLIYLFII